MGALKAMFWPLALVAGLIGGAWLANELELPGIVAAGVALLGAFAGFMIVIFTHPRV